MRLVKKTVLMALLIVSNYYAIAQIEGKAITGEQGITVTVEDLLKRVGPERQNLDLRLVEERKIGRRPVQQPGALKSATFPADASPAVTIDQLNTQQAQSNFLAIELFESGSLPPDPMGDVGETQIGIVTNGRIKFYQKPTTCGGSLTTSTLTGSTSLSNPVFSMDLDEFFADVRGSSTTTDPHMQYDRISGRWFIVAMNTTEPVNRLLLAVSSSGVINNKASFTFYQFQHDQGTSSGQPDNGMFLDFPTLGVDNNAVYMSGLIFDGTTYFGSSLYVIRKTSVLSGGPIIWTPFRQVGTSNTGIFCAQPVSNSEASATQGYYAGVDAGVFSRLDMVVVNNPGGTVSISQSTINVPATDFPIDQVASGSTKPLDAIDDRLVNALLVRNKVNNTLSIWTAHNMAVTNSGVANSGNRNGVRWYQIGVNGSIFSLLQSGTLFDNATTNPIGYWMGSIASSGQGHAILGSSTASTNNAINVAVAGRYNNTASGSLFSPVNYTTYSQAYNQQADGDNQRWGDYSQSVTDPADDMTMWTFQQYTTGLNRWGVRAVQLKAPPPASPLQLSGLGCAPNGASNVTLNGTSSNNSGWFDPGAGYSKRLTVSSTGNATITNVQFITPTQITFTLNYAAATPGTQQTLTITNPDCQAVTFQYTVPQGCALPVTWVDVNAAYDNKDAVINWQVANEEKLSTYEVQASTDGLRFNPIGNVNPQQAATAAYTFRHVLAPDFVFYKIKQVDNDGRFSYSKTVSLKRAVANNNLQLIPNPATSSVQIILPEGGGDLRVLNAAGKLMNRQRPSGTSVYLSTSAWARGIYIVEYNFKGRSVTDKLLLQ